MVCADVPGFYLVSFGFAPPADGWLLCVGWCCSVAIGWFAG